MTSQRGGARQIRAALWRLPSARLESQSGLASVPQASGFEWVTFHTLRKTFATLLDGAGLTAREIADLLGHSNPSMTLNTYMGRGQESRRSAEVLDRAVRVGEDGKVAIKWHSESERPG